jgi:hypothetical protein
LSYQACSKIAYFLLPEWTTTQAYCTWRIPDSL